MHLFKFTHYIIFLIYLFQLQSIIYYTTRSPRLQEWLSSTAIQDGIRATSDESYVDPDPTFSANFDEDYSSAVNGLHKAKFNSLYGEWLRYCINKRSSGDADEQTIACDDDSLLMSLCFALSVLARRVLNTASHNNASSGVEFFLFGLHALFKGDFRITSTRDEWVFADMEMLRRVVAPAVRMSLKLHQDHFALVDDYEECESLYDAITAHEQEMVITHESDPAWRNAVLSNVPSLLSLRCQNKH